MSDQVGHQDAGDSIEHQDEVEDVAAAVVEDTIEDVNAGLSSQAALTNISAITGGESPTEAEFNALVTRVNVLTQVLRDADLIPSA